MKTDNKTLIAELRQKATELIETDSITSSVELVLLSSEFDRCADRIEELIQENAALKEKLDLCDKWQKINKTHEDGTSYLVFDRFSEDKKIDGYGIVVARYDFTHGWVLHQRNHIIIKLINPTHCLPLPEGTEGL